MNYIIDFEQSATIEEINAYLASVEATVVKVFDNFEKVYLVSCATTPVASTIVTSIINDDETVITLLADVTDSTVETSFATQDQENWWKVYTLNKVDLNSTTTTTKIRGADTTVYLLDSGVDSSHPEFSESNIINLYSITGDFTDSTGHGTALASLITGKTCGLSNPTVKVCKIFDQTGATKQSALLSAMDAVINDVLANPRKIAIANMSWSIAKNEYVEAKINIMIDHMVTVVAAAGNSGVPIADITPASMERVVTVGAYNPDLLPCSFSNYTDPSALSYTANDVNYGALDCWAPGEAIHVATVGGGYGMAHGTSLSAAIHSGAISHNSVILVDAQGQVLPCLDDVVTTTRTLSMRRKGLLVLEGNYSSSVNLVTTINNDFTKTSITPREVVVMSAIEGIDKCTASFDPLMVSSFTIDGSLPDGVQIYNGVVHGKLAITNGGEYQTSQVVINILFKDGTSLAQTMHFLVMKPTFDVSQHANSEDPVLAITAQAICAMDRCDAMSCSYPAACIDISGDPKLPECGCY